MPLTIRSLAQAEAEQVAAGVRADRKLWWTVDKTRLVEDSDIEAAFLFASVGDGILPADVAKYGLAVAPNGVIVLPGPAAA